MEHLHWGFPGRFTFLIEIIHKLLRKMRRYLQKRQAIESKIWEFQQKSNFQHHYSEL